jgi:exodeoxyribonuclease VII small subunit
VAQNNRNTVHGENGASFEESFTRLQEVVQKLSEGSLTLQEALSAFEEGMALADRCGQMLEQAELRVKQISARTTRAAAEALDELDEAIRNSPLGDAGDEFSIEIESIEQRVRLDVPPGALPKPPEGNLAYGQLPWERSERQSPQNGGNPGPPRGGNPSTGPGRSSLDDDLKFDPLFDEDD